MGLTQSNHISYNTISSVGKEFGTKAMPEKGFLNWQLEKQKNRKIHN